MKAGWEVKTLGEFTEIRYGYTAKANVEKVGPRFLRITDIQDGKVDWASVPYCEIDDTESAKHTLKNGDIVFARTGATTGKSYLIEDAPEAVCASYLIKVRQLGEDVLPSFLSIYFQTNEYWSEVERGTEGAAQGGFNASKLADLLIPLPPLEEQRRIVAILDQAFDGIARARANIEADLEDAAALRQSTLQSAFDGKLTGDGSREGWEVKTLGEVCEIHSGAGFPLKLQGSINEQFPFFKVGDMNALGNEKHLHHSPNSISDETRRSLNAKIIAPNSLVFPKVGGAILTNKKRLTVMPCCIDNNIMALTPRNQRIENGYLSSWMNSVNIYEFSNKANPPSITQNTVSNWPIPLPPLEAQRQIVTTLDHIFNRITALEATARAKLNDLDDLKQSLLQKAFAGELT